MNMVGRSRVVAFPGQVRSPGANGAASSPAAEVPEEGSTTRNVVTETWPSAASVPRALAASSAEKVPTLSGWGRVPEPGREVAGEDLNGLTRGAALCRGLGRSYGDSSLPAAPTDRVVNTRLANRILSFDERTGVLRAEAGVTLVELNRTLLPRGWFTPVTPGTKFVTLGGMVASDVHGKNHHVDGCFGAHVLGLRLRLANDDVVDVSPNSEPDLFYGTIGGMGLLGHILEVEVQFKRVPSQWIWMETERAGDIGAYLTALDRAAKQWPMTMGWIDCLAQGRALGRGVSMVGRWATPEETGGKDLPRVLTTTLPFELPNWALNRVTGTLANRLIYHALYHPLVRRGGLVTPEAFFYPLDAILQWNRLYGSRGFTQYQCVLPRAAGAEAVREFMLRLARLGCASPLCVIKDCGPEGKGTLSFPLEGTSIAIDMALSSDIQRYVDALNEFVIAAQGRIYLTKDRFTRPEHFRAMEPRLPAFLAARDKWDPTRRLRSAQSRRLFGDRA
jgi:decaprenylphospho-beta-D-ribofuranose 2-oxidase